HPFPKLPQDFRLRIWRQGLPASRIVPIHCGRRDASSSKAVAQPQDYSIDTCISCAIIPAILHVCRESRSEALKEHQLSFAVAGKSGKVFFSSKDALYFEFRDGFTESRSQLLGFVNTISGDQLTHVRCVGMNAAVLRRKDAPASLLTNKSVECLKMMAKHLPHLEQLIVVRHDENPIYGPDSVFIEQTSEDMGLLRRLR
ncbi:uncharacterized protein BCR38DRAFT_333571, partial [Pseudomassariella vexata]